MEHLLQATARAEARHFWFRGFRAFVIPLVRQAVSGRADVQILDCGCGTGANLDWLQRFGRATGFDLSETGLQLGRAAGRSRLVRASVSAAPFRDGSFDLVTSFDVLYSLPDADERTALVEMYRLLRPGGYALINVAAMESLRGDHSVLSREIRRYNRDLLRSRVMHAGFDIERITYAFASLYPAMRLARAWQQHRGLRREDESAAHLEITVPAAPVNAMMTAVVQLEAAWLRRINMPIGSSLICLARRPLEPRT